MWTGLIQNYSQNMSNAMIRHILNNYSEDEVGWHHPKISCGIVFRDQGITDLYSGTSRILMADDGYTLHLGSHCGFVFDSINFTPASVQNFRLLGRHPNPKLFDQQQVVAVKNIAWAQYQIIGPETVILDSQGAPCRIVNPVMLGDLFESVDTWVEDEAEGALLSPIMMIYKDLRRGGCF